MCMLYVIWNWDIISWIWFEMGIQMNVVHGHCDLNDGNGLEWFFWMALYGCSIGLNEM